MSAVNGVGRTLTQLDFVRLCKLNAGSLPDILEAGPVVADLVDAREVPPDVVTMYSQIEIRQHPSGVVSRLTLVYPTDAEPVAGFVSILSPVGASLLGLRVGDTATWDTPNGDECSAEILAVLFQPEATGDFAT